MTNSINQINPDLIAAAETLWDYHCIYDVVEPSDYIIGLGSYDIRVAERCAELFHQNIAPQILFTGDRGNWTRGLFEFSEAKIFGALAERLGVPSLAIILEERATNIGENIRFSAERLSQKSTAIFVTKPQTQRRCRATATKLWANGRTAITAPLHSFQNQPTGTVPMRSLICEMVGDLDRMKTYPKLGYQAPEDIPKHVLAAQQMLIDAGFVEHLLPPKSQG